MCLYRFCIILIKLFFSGCLSIEDLNEVIKATWQARVEWYDIGLGLHISPNTLDAIRNDNRDICKACFREMLKVWLKRSHPPPTWKELVETLRSPMVGFEHIAELLSPRAAI